MKVAVILALLASAPLLARAQTTYGGVGAATARDGDVDRADSVIINTRNIPKPKPSTNQAATNTQQLVYSNPGGELTYGGGAMASTRSQTALGGVSNVNVNKNKIWYANTAGGGGRVYPAARARTSLTGPLDFGGTRDINIRGNVRSTAAQNDNLNSLGPVTIAQTYYARSSAGSGAWLYTSRRGRNSISMTDPAFNIGPGGPNNRAGMINNSAIGAMGSFRRTSNAVSGSSTGFGVQTRTRKSSAIALAGGRR